MKELTQYLSKSKFDFGKHKGKTIQDVYNSDNSGYIKWALMTIDSFYMTKESIFKLAENAPKEFIAKFEAAWKKAILNNTTPQFSNDETISGCRKENYLASYAKRFFNDRKFVEAFNIKEVKVKGGGIPISTEEEYNDKLKQLE